MSFSPDPEHQPAPAAPSPQPQPSEAPDIATSSAASHVTADADADASRGRNTLFFAGGLLSGAVGAVLALSLLGLVGTPATGESAGASAAASPAAGASASALALVTPPPIVTPATLTPTDLADGNVLGAGDAAVTVEVWADYQCPYCARFSADVEPQIIQAYVATGRVRLVFRDLAFLGDESRWAAVAARLAGQQGKFWPYHDYLFANQLGENVGSFDVARLKEIASRVGLDRSAFDAGMEIEAARALFAEIQSASEADATALGVHATPSVVVNGTLLEGNDWATVKAAIDAALAQPASPAPAGSADASPQG